MSGSSAPTDPSEALKLAERLEPQALSVAPRLRNIVHAGRGWQSSATILEAANLLDDFVRALRNQEDRLEHAERVMTGLNKQLTEQFELSTKFAREKLAAEAERDASKARIEELSDAIEAALFFLDDGHAIGPTLDRYRLCERLRTTLGAQKS
jgi:hypothetical protein